MSVQQHSVYKVGKCLEQRRALLWMVLYFRYPQHVVDVANWRLQDTISGKQWRSSEFLKMVWARFWNELTSSCTVASGFWSLLPRIWKFRERRNRKKQSRHLFCYGFWRKVCVRKKLRVGTLKQGCSEDAISRQAHVNDDDLSARSLPTYSWAPISASKSTTTPFLVVESVDNAIMSVTLIRQFICPTTSSAT